MSDLLGKTFDNLNSDTNKNKVHEDTDTHTDFREIYFCVLFVAK